MTPFAHTAGHEYAWGGLHIGFTPVARLPGRVDFLAWSPVRHTGPPAVTQIPYLIPDGSTGQQKGHESEHNQPMRLDQTGDIRRDQRDGPDGHNPPVDVLRFPVSRRTANGQLTAVSLSVCLGSIDLWERRRRGHVATSGWPRVGLEWGGLEGIHLFRGDCAGFCFGEVNEMRKVYTFEIATRNVSGRWVCVVRQSRAFTQPPDQIVRSLLELWVNDNREGLEGGQVFVYRHRLDADPPDIDASVRVRVFCGGYDDHEQWPSASGYIGYREPNSPTSRRSTNRPC